MATGVLARLQSTTCDDYGQQQMPIQDSGFGMSRRCGEIGPLLSFGDLGVRRIGARGLRRPRRSPPQSTPSCTLELMYCRSVDLDGLRLVLRLIGRRLILLLVSGNLPAV